MDRRRFLTTALYGGAALMLARPALSAVVDDPSTAFARGLARHPWLAGWQDAPDLDGELQQLDVIGAVPVALAGTLYRNGPGRFSRAGLRYRHWFDGDGLLQAWRIGVDGIAHRTRFIGTSKFRREEAAGRFMLPAAGTWIPGASSIRNSDDMNVANTAVMTHGDELFALWEGGSAYAIDARTLESRGPKAWRDDLAAMPFSAHPLHEADGSLWNFGLMGTMLVVWHLAADGAVRELRTIELPYPGYLHAFSMTARHLVFVVLPYVRDEVHEGKAYFESMRWRPERGCLALVLDKDDAGRERRFELPAGAAYHYGPARQHGRELVLQACWNADGEHALSPFASELAGVPRRMDTRPSLQQIILPLDGGSARMDTLLPGAIDFPDWNTQSPECTFALHESAPTESGYFDSVIAVNDARGVVDGYHYGAGCMVEEHRFVRRASARGPRDGWLVGTVLDYRRGRTGISILDAADLAAGPRAQAWLPYTLPLGFHGWFAARG